MRDLLIADFRERGGRLKVSDREPGSDKRTVRCEGGEMELHLITLNRDFFEVANQ